MLRRLPFHVVLFSIYPALTLLAHNAYEIRFIDAVRALIFSVLVAVAVLAAIYLFLRSLETAGIMASVFMLAFFSYGHLYEWGRQISPSALAIVRHRFLLPAFVAVFAVLIVHLWRRRYSAQVLTPGLNIAGVVLVFLPMTTVVRAEFQFQQSAGKPEAANAECRLEPIQGNQSKDLYYLVLDGYAREDVLAETFEFENRPFIEALEQRGFFVADGSQSNYATTGLSLASSLNMAYLSLPDDAPEKDDPTRHWPSLSQGEVRRQLACLGYNVVAFDSGYYWSGWRDADVFLGPEQGRDEALTLAGLNAFEAILVNTTLLRAPIDAAVKIPEVLAPDVSGPLREHRDRVLFTFDALEESVAGLAGPKFVFAHVVSPHRPYVFGPNGEPRGLEGVFTFDDNLAGEELPETVAYPDQLQYINQRVLKAVDGILAAYPEDNKPVIIIQGDHGTSSGMADRMRILNAYYLPEGGEKLLYETISPVNTFRAVFNAYFDADYQLLPDVSCYSTYEKLYDFQVVPNPIASNREPVDAAEICD